MIPSPWEFALIALAVFRLWKLVAEDNILDRPREYLLTRYKRLEDLVECPWCLGFWITVGWWVAWLVWPHAAVVAAVPFALSATVGAVAHFLDA